MPRILEIPPLDEVKKMQRGGRTWMYAKISDHHDAALELNCESRDGEHIAHAAIELRTRSGQGGYSINTGNAIATIACENEPHFYEIKVGERLWRPAERNNGIIALEREVSDTLILTIINAQQRCEVILHTREEAVVGHNIRLPETAFARFLALGGAIQADWEVGGNPIEKLRGMPLIEALQSHGKFLLGESYINTSPLTSS